MGTPCRLRKKTNPFALPPFPGGHRLKILLCHERFVFRYGVDRVLLALAREWRQRGHHVTLLGMAFDASSESPLGADRIVRVPAPAETLAADVAAAEWIAGHWEECFAGENRPDIVVDAGWPFFSAIPIFESHGCRVVFQDHGVIPKDGMPEIGWRTLHLVEELKQTFVRVASAIVAVSAFVRETQSRACAAPAQPVVVIPNGIDHVAPPASGAEKTPPVRAAEAGPEACVVPPASGLRILCAGRFEPGLYKQSELVFALAEHLRTWAPEAWIGTLATREALEAAAGPGRSSAVVAVGQPGDDAMVRLVQACDVVVCFSRWEGFNLPLAEAQVLGRPCLVFDLAAHPEVVADPWLLCADLGEMAAKIRALAEGTAPAGIRDGSVFRAWHAATGRSWRDVAGRYLECFDLVHAGRPRAGALPRPAEDAGPRTLPGTTPPAVLMDVTNAVRDPSNSGCVRVARRLAAEWQAYLEVAFVVWEREAQVFRFPTAAEFAQLGAFRGPVRSERHPVSEPGAPVLVEPWLLQRRGSGARDPADGSEPAGWLVLPEIRHRPDLWPILEFAARIRWRTASIFHDAIPLERPELVPDPAYREGHADYMRGLCRVDVSVANSRASADALRNFWRAEGLSGRVTSCLLPGGLSGERPTSPVEVGAPRQGVRHGSTAMPAPLAEASSRSPYPETATGEPPFLLMVSTLEPRKGFRRLIEAFLTARARAGRSDWRLVLVGGRSWWSADISRFVEDAVRQHPGITWLENAPDDRLGQLYRTCAFTVYASEIEGFGLPIMESVWYGCPCLCHDAGVMRELAGGGGCMTADLLHPEAFEAALLQLMDDGALRERLAAECRARSVKRWEDFAAEFWARLAFVRWSDLESPRAAASDGVEAVATPTAGRLSFIIPTFNRLDLLQVCLRTLRATIPAALDAEILVVDDASGDGTRLWLERGEGDAAGLRVLRHATNRGYGASINHAARVATGERLVLLNHDLSFRPGWLEPMLAAAQQRPGCFGVGNLQCSARDGSLDHAGIVFDPAGHPEHFRAAITWIQRVPVREFPAITFACALVDRGRFLALGGLDAGFLNGFEDVDLCLRARAQGWPCVVANTSLVDHQISATPGRKLAEAENRHRFFARWRAQAVVLGRDWEERLAWERSGGAGLPDDSRPPGPWRVLLDLTPFTARGDDAIPVETLHEIARLPRRGPGAQFLPVIVATPAQCLVMKSTCESTAIVPEDAEVWCFCERATETRNAVGVRLVSGPAITVARRLQADVLYAPAGESSLASPDVPLLLAASAATPAAPMHARGGAKPPWGVHGHSESKEALEERLAGILLAYSSGGGTWRWAEAFARTEPPGAGGGSLCAGVPEVGADAVLFCVDEPAVWEEAVPLVEIRGWCLHRESIAVTEVSVRTRSGRVWRGVAGRARPDVAAAFPAVATAGASGFSVRVPAPRESFELWAGGAGFAVRLREWRVRDADAG